MSNSGQELKKVPFLKLVFPFIAGIILEIFIKADNALCLSIFLLASIIFIILSVFRIQKNFVYGFVWGVAINFFVFSLGICLTGNQLKNLEPPAGFNNSKLVIAEVGDIPVSTAKGLKLPVIVTYFNSDNSWKKCNEKCNLYIETDSLIIKPGNILVIKSNPRPIDYSVSPYQFDFKSYLYYKGTLFSIYAKSKNITKLNLPEKQSISLISIKIRGFLLDKLEQGGITKEQNPVLSALLLGYSGNIDPDVRNSYATAGVMHILSVSGMHVGIVYLFLLYMLFFMEKNKYLKVLRTAIIICALWFYALIAGFSPPVIRAATMFSFFAVGQALNRNTNEFNTLAASALFMLILNPLQIMDLGFQLSYSAMIGIFIFYKPLYELWSPSAYILDKTWALVALSISAQLGTLPLSLYYFHQFPTYFLVTNIVIVPLTGFIIYGGLAFLILSFWPFAITILAAVLNFLLNFLDYSVSLVEYLPMASISGIYISLFETIFLSIMIFVVALWVKTLNKKLVFAFLSATLIFVGSVSLRQINQFNQKVLIVHNTGSRMSVSIIKGQEWLLIADSSAKAKIDNASINMVAKYGIRKVHFLNSEKSISDTVVCNTLIHTLNDRNFVADFGGKKILIIKDCSDFKSIEKHLKLDYIINFTKKGKLNYLHNTFTTSVFIADNASGEEIGVKEENKFFTKGFFISEQGSFKEDL